MSINWSPARKGFRRKPGLAFAACLVCAALGAGCGKKDEEAKGGPKDEPAGSVAVSGPVSPKETGTLVLLHGEMQILPGMKIRSEQKLEMKDGVLTTDSPGGKSQGHLEMSDHERRRVEYVSEKEKRVVLEEKQAVLHMETGGAEPVDTDVTSALEGRELTALRRQDGNWWFGLAEGEADAAAVNELVDLGKRETLGIGAYPKEPRALGDSWESPLDTVAALLGTGFQASEGTVTMRLDRLTSYEGQRCAEISVTLECSGTYAGTGAPMAMKLDLTGTILRSLNTFQDLGVKLAGPITLEAASGDGTKVTIEGTVLFGLENHVTRE